MLKRALYTVLLIFTACGIPNSGKISNDSNSEIKILRSKPIYLCKDGEGKNKQKTCKGSAVGNAILMANVNTAGMAMNPVGGLVVVGVVAIYATAAAMPIITANAKEIAKSMERILVKPKPKSQTKKTCLVMADATSHAAFLCRDPKDFSKKFMTSKELSGQGTGSAQGACENEASLCVQAKEKALIQAANYCQGNGMRSSAYCKSEFGAEAIWAWDSCRVHAQVLGDCRVKILN